MKIQKYHAVISASLHTGNIGDNALVKAFINQQRENYQNFTILGDAHPDLLSIDETIITPPPMAIGYRFWYGYQKRVETRKKIIELMPESIRHHVWLGGLLGANIYHTKNFYKQFEWASSFSEKIIYYFGDVSPGFQNLTVAKKLINKINYFNSWIAVRSIEAADLLIDAGLTSKVFVGIDAVLFERCKNRSIPFVRQQKDVGAVAIIVCQFRSDTYIQIWRAAAVSAIKLGMKIFWISLSDGEDMVLCQQLCQEFSGQHPHHPMEIVSGMDGENKIAQASVCVATRFHGTIFSITSGVPTIAVPYDAKVQRLFKFLNLTDWIADPNLKPDTDADWNSILYEMLQAALSGNFQVDYSRLKAGIKTHEEALSDFALFIRN
jgi:polysaccharide pyruvyl transferase WcaK-like protein